MEASQELVKAGFSSKITPPSGVRKGAVLVINECPSKKDDETSTVLHPESEAGGLFTRLLNRVGVDRDNLCLTNCVWQKPPYELYDEKGPLWYTEQALAYWQPAVRELIEQIQPPVVIGLGRSALKMLTGFTELDKNRGYVNFIRFRTEQEKGPYDFAESPFSLEELSIPCVCTYAPGFLNRGSLYLSGVWLRDVLAGLEIGEKGWVRPRLKVVPVPDLEGFKSGFARVYNPERHRLTYDIETVESGGLDEDELEGELTSGNISFEIERMSFCFDSEVGGWSIPWVNGFRDEAKALLASAGPKRSWNGRLFDRPRLERYGLGINGREYDLLDAWRHLNRTLPASLAFVAPFYLAISPWKHMSHTQPEFYSAMDAICQHEVAEGIERDLRSTGQYEVYERHVVEILALGEQMKKNGMPFDMKLGKEFEIELEGKYKERAVRLQDLAPERVKGLEPKAGYKTLPKKIKAEVAAGQVRGVMVKKDSKGEPREFGYTLIEREFQIPWEKLTKVQKTGIEPVEFQPILRWVKQVDFNPGSFKQKLQLIKAFGHKAKTDRKTKNETSGEETLKSLISAHCDSKKENDIKAVEAYRTIRECQALSKVLGTYVKGWRPGADGKIHATPGIWGDMFRLSWRKPNLAATVSDKKEVQIASGFRRCIACAEDEVIIESDWRGMESVIVAFLAGDEQYMRLARMSPHAYLASHILGNPADLAQSDEDLAKELRLIKKSHDPHVIKTYDDAKHCIAEGELVLTRDRGLVPIEAILLSDLLWDGVEWVRHEGVIYQGIREVITYNGLTATPDHKVVTEDGRVIPFGQAASEVVRLETTGDSRKAIRTSHGDFLKTSAQERLRESQSQVRSMWQKTMGRQKEFNPGKNQRLSEVPSSRSLRRQARRMLYQYSQSLRQAGEPGVQMVWWPRYSVQIQNMQRIQGIHRDQSLPLDLQRNNNRSDKQRWALRTGEFKISCTTGTNKQPQKYPENPMERSICAVSGISNTVYPVMDTTPLTPGFNRGTNTRKTFDIVNAGPRRCFTVSNYLVFNCVHGISYGMSTFLMSELYEMSRKRAQFLIDLFFALFPKVKQWQQSTIKDAHMHTRLVNPWGYRMPFWDVYRWNQRRYDKLKQLWIKHQTNQKIPAKTDMRWVQRIELEGGNEAAIARLSFDLGDEAKSAVSFLPRDIGAAMLKDALLTLEEKNQLVSKGVIRCSIHDSILAICKRSDAPEVAEAVRNAMAAPVARLNGLVIEVEQSWGRTWEKSQMEEWK